MVRSVFLGAVSVIAIAASARAADVYTPAEPGGYKDSPYATSWTGFYAGVNAGLSGGQFSQRWDDFGVPYAKDDARSSGFSGGGQAGFNYQFPASNFVVGFEADLQRSTLEGTYADYGSSNLQFGSQVDWWGTLRARSGYAFGNILPYLTGGFAYGHVTNSYYCPTSSCATAYSETWSSVRTGWTAGAGVDYAITHNLAFQVDYLYTDLGSWRSQDPQDSKLFPGEFHNDVSSGFNTVRVGLNYKFEPGYEPLK
ncbi:MAG: outer membrane protein [Rhodomicrobium sp.]